MHIFRLCAEWYGDDERLALREFTLRFSIRVSSVRGKFMNYRFMDWQKKIL